MIIHNPKDIGEIYEHIPVWNNGVWELISFDSREEFAKVLEDEYFIEPGTYKLDQDTKDLFRSEAANFEKRGYYCNALEESIDFEQYWDFEKLKCRKGVFFYIGDRKYFLPRHYYFWINFTQIFDKIKKKSLFTTIWDTQIWLALYEWIAELKYKHAAVLKKRQFGSSFYHAARLINLLWFEEKVVLKMGASLDAYLTGVNGTWKYLQSYRSFLNKNTAWIREMNPGTVGEWKQNVEVTENGIKSEFGLGGTLQSISFQQSDTAGVGGATSEFFYEEAGIAPRMDKTLEFLLPAMEAGDLTTGFFVAAGTVGDLDQCKPLHGLIYKARQNNIYTIKNKWCNDAGVVMETGIFIPEQYSMPPFIDDFGNSLVDKAVARLKELYAEWEQNLAPDVCQIRKSQKPINMEVAFATRGESKFPTALVKSHKFQISEGAYPHELVKLERDVNGKIQIKNTTKSPILEFPVDKKALDKTGSIVMWERPIENPEFGTYYASVDPVSEGKTVSSESLCSIYIYKNPIQVTKRVDNKTINYVEGDKIVASWAGRFDDINDTHELLEMLIEIYNAWTLVEANVSLFIVHMIAQRKQKYLVPKNEMVFLKEHGSNLSTFQEYGWKNTGTLFINNLLPYLINSLKEKIYVETDEEGNETKVVYGITRIPDIMAHEEMLAYEPGVNVDRLISLAALIAFVKLQNANKGYKKRFETDEDKHLENSDKIYTLNIRSPFKNVGYANRSTSTKPTRSPFKRLR